MSGRHSDSEISVVKWLLVCRQDLPVEQYGELLPGVPSAEETAGCPASFMAVYLEADIEQVRPLTSSDDRVCRLRPVWEEPSLSPAELLILGRRIESLHEDREEGGESQPPEE